MHKLKSLRDEFAIAALTGLVADPNMKGNVETFAKACYELADAMMAAREETNEV